MFTWELCCTLLCVLWFYILWSRRRFYKLIFQIPGPLGYPLIGMAHKLLHKNDVLRQITYYKEKHGPCIFSWLGPMPFLIVSDPQVVQNVFNSPHCINKAIVYNSIKDAMGLGLFSESEPNWSVHRKLINPSFSYKMLVNFIPIFNTETANLVKMVDQFVDCGEKDWIPILYQFTLNTSYRTTIGTDVKANEYTNSKNLCEVVINILGTATDMCFSPWLLSKTVRQLLGRDKQYTKNKLVLTECVREFIETKIKNGRKTPPHSDDNYIFFNLVIDLMNRGILTKKEVEGHTSNMILSALETSVNIVAYTLILLAMFPEYQEKAFEEIRSLFPEAGDFEVTYADTQNMPYMDLILNESMRVLPPVPLVARQTMQDVLLSNGVLIPKGVQIAISIFHLHRDKKIWGEKAETFYPEHFLPQHMEDKHPYSYVPFTKGIRNCIGWRYALISTKVTLAKLLRNYTFTTSFKFEDLHFVEHITLKFEQMPQLAIQRRD
ncbi:hypothetical protein KR093_001708 [Drosophila rubida]|uniref:Uncharacterized protein n=1 Tax=Drosophila rubida TaxID=30044 RepID=A0AAD4K6Y9_9MUSC|nr:hypothetical protein KR093_001708 [Drosophila rubida]